MKEITMKLISNSDYISTSALYGPSIQHGLISWIKHRYVRREGTPGNYSYIYPEDLKKRREARRAANDSRATLFGDRQKQSSYRTWLGQEKRLERQQKKNQKRLEKATRKAEYYSARQLDPTLKKSQRNRFKKRQARYEAAAKALTTKITEIEYTRARVQVRKLIAQSAYNRSRTIDEVPEDIVDVGRAFLGAAHRAIKKVAYTEYKFTSPHREVVAEGKR